MAFRSFLKFVGIRQNSKPEIITFKVDQSAVQNGASTTNGLVEGSKHGTIQRIGTGDYVITLNRKCRRKIAIIGAVLNSQIGVIISDQADINNDGVASITYHLYNMSSVKTNADHTITLLCLYDKTER